MLHLPIIQCKKVQKSANKELVTIALVPPKRAKKWQKAQFVRNQVNCQVPLSSTATRKLFNAFRIWDLGYRHLGIDIFGDKVYR